METSRKVEQFVSEKKSSQIDVKERLMPGTLPFITITTQSGAGGNRLADSLLERIEQTDSDDPAMQGWRIFDKSMCQRVLDEEHLADSMDDLLDQDYHSQIREFVMGLYGDQGMQNVAYARLARLLRTVATVGKVIILGHGGCMATRGLSGGTNIRLVAPLAHRATRMAPLLGVDEAQAMKQIRRRDKGQQKLLKTHYRIDSNEPEHYDLVCNTGRLSISTVTDMLMVHLGRQLGH